MLAANSVQLSETATSKLVGEYADLSKGIEKMKGVQVDLQVDPAILPVERMANDIIGKVDKPTSWVSPVVITLKLSVKEVRLNVDMRVGNKAIRYDPSPYATQL